MDKMQKEDGHMKFLISDSTYNFAIDIIPWNRPLLPPRTGSRAKRRPTAQS